MQLLLSLFHFFESTGLYSAPGALAGMPLAGCPLCEPLTTLQGCKQLTAARHPPVWVAKASIELVPPSQIEKGFLPGSGWPGKEW